MSEAIDRQLVEVRALRERTKREAQRAAERLARVKRDYQDGNLDADDWREQRAELAAEQVAADAEGPSGSVKHESAIKDGGTLNDVEATTVQRLADLRAAVVGEVRDARGRGQRPAPCWSRCSTTSGFTPLAPWTSTRSPRPIRSSTPWPLATSS